MTTFHVDPSGADTATTAPRPDSAAAAPGHVRLLRSVVAVAILAGPLGYLVGGTLAPSLHLSGQATIAANRAANPVTNTVHLAAFVVASFLLPVGAVGLGWLARHRAPWLATIGGLLAVIGWLPFAALAALDDLAVSIAHQPASGGYAELLDRFTNDAVMNTYLIVYIVGHLLAYVLLGIALRRARVIPAWAGAALIASSPVMIAAFALPLTLRDSVGVWFGIASVALMVLGSAPAAARMLRAETHL